MGFTFRMVGFPRWKGRALNDPRSHRSLERRENARHFGPCCGARGSKTVTVARPVPLEVGMG